MLLICLATFNGEKYLDELLESISHQSVREWQLIVSDDESTDSTRDIIQRWSAADPRIKLLPGPGHNVGVIANFGRLAEEAITKGADHVAFADQDDVWHSFKLQKQMEAMRRLEATASAETPLLIHTDSEIVDCDLNRLHASHRQYAAHGHHTPDSEPIDFLLLSNYVTGCTMLANRALLQMGVPLPSDVFMHDWWLAQLAAVAGEIGYVPESTILYRQHGKNEMGAQASAFKRSAERILGGVGIWKKDMRRFERILRQSSELVRRLQCRPSKASTQELDRIRAFTQLFEASNSPFRRLKVMRKMGLPKGHFPDVSRPIAESCC